MKTDLSIVDLRADHAQGTASKLASSFRAAKPDSLVCRMPGRLVAEYFRNILAAEGRILVAQRENESVGFLVFVRDNNLTLRFLRRHKYRVALGLLCSWSLQDKKLLMEALLSAVRMGSSELPSDFRNEISLLAVRPSFAGQGIGKHLIERLMQTWDGEIKVKTSVNNVGAIRFYRRMGFVEYAKLQAGARTLICFERAGMPDS